MRYGAKLPRLAAGLLLWPLSACSVLDNVTSGTGEVVHVEQVRQAVSCNSDGPQPRLSLLADEAAVRAWQQAHGVDLIGAYTLPSPGPFALVEMGVHLTAGYGIVVSSQAEVRNGVLRLSASQLTPSPGQAAAQVVTSPCELLALPPRAYYGLELRDPSARLLADVVTRVQ